ncbi:conserved hypothetical protein [Uncinocarpus reesii 1704]|uniref:Uncharacterized protein n=1 Tax=Uncinocarpus reesii (strain UAMH 1704) TaxID=336963 RepID=C4JHL9_UNCRE|nr:uncharacterized protein UREG_02705 [Uncinocarpus reesii 1704]EEP77856.1 conserved hypothetical protein [Uncinocarpus reesii 1704]
MNPGAHNIAIGFTPAYPETLLQHGEPLGQSSSQAAMDLVSDFADGLSYTPSNHSSDFENYDMNIDSPAPFMPSNTTTPSYLAPPNFGAHINHDDMIIDDEYVFTALSDNDDVNDAPHSAQVRFTRDDGSLIERSDLVGFAHDRLPPTMILGLDNDPNDSSDTEQFYVSDDEFSIEDAAEAVGNGRFTDTHEHCGPLLDDQPSYRDLAPSTYAFGAEYAPSVNAVFAQPNDDEAEEVMNTNQGGLSMHTESMNACFLSCSFATPMNPFAQIPKDAVSRPSPNNLVYRMEGISLYLRELGSSFANTFSTMIETRIYEFLVSAKSHLGPGFAPGVLHNDIFVNQPIISFLSDFRLLHAFPQDLEQYHRYMLALVSSGLSRQEGPSNGDVPFLLTEVSELPFRPSEDSLLPQNGQPQSSHVSSALARTPRPLLSEEEYLEIHESSGYSHFYIHPAFVLLTFADEDHLASSLLATPLVTPEGELYMDANGNQYPAFERNLTVDQFIRQWLVRYRNSRYTPRMIKDPFIPISGEAANVLDWARPAKISRPASSSKLYDIQGIPWSTTLKVKRSDARALRDRLYTSYHNLKYTPHYYSATLPEEEDYFRPKTMYTKYRASMAHFQLRNLMSVTASNTIQYAYQSRIYSITPFYNEQNCLINLADPRTSRSFFESVKISTMKAKHGVTFVGGFAGEYAFRGDITDYTLVDGRITKDPNGITNHIDIIEHRTSRSPRAVISSNDERIRILDCETNRFVSNHKFARAINCTDTSPDGRLRVVIGDAPDAWIIDSETGKPVQTLIGHRDYGFACAWSPDMLHIATSNQDKTVNIWDARMWRILQSIDSDIAGYRSLRFSPVGGGPRTLLMCEPADRIAIVNAQSYQTRQVHDFFGEIGGADYSPDGSRIWVANMDVKFGGFMEFDRHEWGQEFGIAHTRRRRIECQGDLYYPELPNEWLPDADLDDDARCVLGAGERKLRFQKLFNNLQYEMLDPRLG